MPTMLLISLTANERDFGIVDLFNASEVRMSDAVFYDPDEYHLSHRCNAQQHGSKYAVHVDFYYSKT